MAGSVNKVIIVGLLGKDPEIRTMQSGDRVANMSVATSERWTDKSSGEKKEKTEWHRVIVFNDNLAKVAEQYLKKGSQVYIEGSLQTRKWTDQQGVERYSTEVVLQKFNGTLTILGKADGGGSNVPGPDSYDDYGTTKTRDTTGGGQSTQNFDLDDEIPFITSNSIS